ncbi:MAG TPA: type II secretion system F family protein [Jatrophihabitans sp.]|nr:type II secretion system F family protein [Jatrophihabitans sp.]
MTTAGWLAAAAALALLTVTPDQPPRHRAGRSATGNASALGNAPALGKAPAGRAQIWSFGCALLIALAMAALAGPTGLILAAPVAAGVGLMVNRLLRLQRRPPPEPRSVAVVLDLLAATLAAGAPPESAIAAVAGAVIDCGTASMRQAVEPVRLVGRLLRLGSDPVTAWARLDAVPGMQQVSAAGRRCAHSGARLAWALADAAAEIRMQHRARAVARAERTGVWALLPLGCCFLPAFVCLGVLPVVLGVAGPVISGG